MNVFLKRLGAAVLLLGGAAVAASAQMAEPIITFHTTVYDNAEAENVFHFNIGSTEPTYIDVDTGFGPMEVEVDRAEYDTTAGEILATTVTCTVSSEGIVRIYGDASKIDYLDLEGIYMDWIEWPQMTNLDVLNVMHNDLKSLDLSHMKNLSALYLSDNPGSPDSPIIIGADKPYLTILDAAMIEWIDPEFDIANYPQLRSFIAYATPSLTRLTPSGCPLLIQLSADSTNISELDVTRNQHLQILNVAGTKVHSLDLSQNALLAELYIGHDGATNTDYKFTEIDLSANPRLMRLFCGGNALTTLDVSCCPNLLSLMASHNRLTSINITGCDQIYEMNLRGNFLTFTTCPLPSPNYLEYFYVQNPLKVDRSFRVGSTLDLTEAAIRPDSDTDCILYVAPPHDPLGSAYRLDESSYTYNDGKITFDRIATQDSIYAAFVCNDFPEWTMTTTKFVIKDATEYGKPSAVASMETSLTARDQKLSVGILGATPEKPVEFFVDFGNGVLVPFKATSTGLPSEPNVNGQRKGNFTTIYVNDENDITALGVANMRLSSVDVKLLTALQELSLTNCGLKNIELKRNRLLNYLNLSGNNLDRIDLSEDATYYLKTHLNDINLSNNQLQTMTLVDNYGIDRLNVANNKLTEINLVHMTGLESLDISGNLISEVSLSDCESLTELRMAANLVSELTIPDYVPLATLDIRDNKFTFATMPAADSAPEFLYAPQQALPMPTKAPSVNLSDQNVPGSVTRYEWRMADTGAPVTAGIEGEDGKFKFVDPNIGLVYCAMTNDAWPAFAGENVLRTASLQTAEPPTNCFLSFATEEDADVSLSLAAIGPDKDIYINWGDDNFEQYILDYDYSLFQSRAIAGKTAKCYSYDDIDPVRVFSMGGVKLSEVDASNMKSVLFLGLSNAGLKGPEIKYPTVSSFKELRLDYNELTEFDCSKLPNLTFLSMNANKLTSIDLTPLQELRVCYLAANMIDEVALDNPSLWEFSLAGNQLKSFDAAKIPNVQQLWLGGNQLESVDVSGADQLTTLHLASNNLDFMTLPRPKEQYHVYSYENQRPLKVEVKDDQIVDLSDEASVGDTETEYRWFIDTPYFTEEGELIGEELIEGTEYTIENGVTTFLKPFQNLICVMTNDVFPNLWLYTEFLNVSLSGIAEFEAEDATALWFDLQGRQIPTPTEPGLYIRKSAKNTQKVLVK